MGTAKERDRHDKPLPWLRNNYTDPRSIEGQALNRNIGNIPHIDRTHGPSSAGPPTKHDPDYHTDKEHNKDKAQNNRNFMAKIIIHQKAPPDVEL
jgi:hypothetical protein